MWFGFPKHKAFPGLMWKPLAPFVAAAAIVTYGISEAQTALMNSDEFKNDPRNPNARKP